MIVSDFYNHTGVRRFSVLSDCDWKILLEAKLICLNKSNDEIDSELLIEKVFNALRTRIIILKIY